jgi:hypothetical protein
MHENIQRYLSEDIREYWNERIRSLSTVPPDLLRPFFSIFSDNLTEWRGRQIAGTRMAIARVYDQFPLFKTLDSGELESNPEYESDETLLRAMASAYEELLNDVDEAIVEIGSGDIHPFNLPEAVRLTRESLPTEMRAEMDAVIREHELEEFWTTMGLTLAQVLVVFIPLLGPALAFGIGLAMAAADIESLLDRVELAEASTSPDSEILGTASPGAFDYLMAGLEVLLTAVDLGMMVSELRATRPMAGEAEALAWVERETAVSSGAPEGGERRVRRGSREEMAEETASGEIREAANELPDPEVMREEYSILSRRLQNPENIRSVTDVQLLDQGYQVEIEAGGHWYRKRADGVWCRFSRRRCGVDVPPELDRAATSIDEGLHSHLLRQRPGFVEGGARLPQITGPWFNPAHARVAPFPRQIAERMRRIGYFRNWREFRETFWRMVEQDPFLRIGWSDGNIASMRRGHAPHVEASQAVGGGPNAVWQLNHVHPLEHGGALYDFDNIEVVSPLFHRDIGRDP